MRPTRLTATRRRRFFDQPRKFERVAGGNYVIMHDAHRILPLTHMQAREGSPRSADRVECAPVKPTEQFDPRERFSDDFGRFLGRPLREIHQRQTAQRQGEAIAGLTALHVDQLERAAPQIAHNAIRPMNRTDHSKRRQPGFLLSAEQLDLASYRALGEAEELRAVRCVANRRGGDAAKVADPHCVAENAKSMKRSEHFDDRIFRKQAGRRHPPPQAAKSFFVECRSWRPRVGFVRHQTHGIRADIDNGYRLAGQPPLRLKSPALLIL